MVIVIFWWSCKNIDSQMMQLPGWNDFFLVRLDFPTKKGFAVATILPNPQRHETLDKPASSSVCYLDFLMILFTICFWFYSLVVKLNKNINK